MKPRRLRDGFRWPWLLAIWRFLKRATDPMLRAIHQLETQRPDVLLQPYPDTELDRHPALFALVRDALIGISEPRLLSFGCSTGDEPITLARYLPNARIDAIDINAYSLSIARTKADRAGIGTITFTLADRPPHLREAYDAIFCLSVLRHGRLDAERPEYCSAILPFSRFDAIVTKLDYCLKSGGLLIVWGSHFDFSAARVSAGFTAQIVPHVEPHSGPVYGPDDRLIVSAGQHGYVFRKRCNP
jgi:SAM-dependent methyltransferase